MEREMFTKKGLKRLIIPLIIEQVLAVTVGMADTIMIASKGEAAVSGVSLVDTINILLIGLFSSLATGGAVVVAQFIGCKNLKTASKAADQLVLSIGVVSLFLMGLSLAFNEPVLRLIYGNIDPQVMAYARTYFYLSAASYPFLALYNAGAALFRAQGNSKVSMNVSFFMNLINVFGNAIFLMVFNMNVAGVALSTLISRMIAAIMMMLLLRGKHGQIHIDPKFRLGFDWVLIKKILSIGIPNGLENSVFQFGKIMVSGLLSTFGTMAITANAVASTVCGLEVLPGNAISLAIITVVGQCVGAGDLKQARKYAKKLLKLIYILMLALNSIILLLLGPICLIFNLSPQTAALAKELMLIHSLASIVIWPVSFALPNVLRAANDAKFTMAVSIICMWSFRIGLSYLLANTLGWGVIGIWAAMIIDWSCRAVCFLARFISGRWEKKAAP